MRQQRLGDCCVSRALPQYQRQGARGIAQLAADTQQVARLCTAARQGLASRHAAEHGQGQAQRPTGGIAAHQAYAAALRHGVQALGIALQPIGFDARRGQGKGKGEGVGAHGGQVAHRHGQRALAEQERVTGVGKMHASHQRIGGDCQLLPGGKRQQGAVVADPQGNAFAALRTGRGGEVGADQLKLTH